jgi:hypothetical protein
MDDGELLEEASSCMPIGDAGLTTGLLSMAIRLDITIDEDVYQRLKRELPAKGISRFINDAIRARFRPSRGALDNAYRTAARRRAEARDGGIMGY